MSVQEGKFQSRIFVQIDNICEFHEIPGELYKGKLGCKYDFFSNENEENAKSFKAYAHVKKH